ncbi:MAG: hypothetical protein MJB14_14820 [Spirochaetes bacterium]|nr:hypothetical protein [Spirochaetota bacterium]
MDLSKLTTLFSIFQNHYWQFFIITFVACIITVILTLKFDRLLKQHKLQKQFKRGIAGETTAKKYLLRNGFKILAEQLTLHSEMKINDLAHQYTTRIDYLVKKKGRIAIVEVKTGKKAINAKLTDTRRQIFEYYHLYRPDDLYLFNADEEKLEKITFSSNIDQQSPLYYKIIMTIIILAIPILLLYLSIILKIL